MDYNTQREQLKLPDYGRNIQKMVNFCATIRDRKERTRVAQGIVDIMGNMNPHLRDVPDFKHKLWDHLAIMSQFSLDIDWPYTVVNKQVLYAKPESVPYSIDRIRYKHYGKYIQAWIQKIIELEDKDEKLALLVIIANYMKVLFVTWKKEQVPDTLIFEEINILSKGKIEIPEGLRLNEVKESVVTQPSNKSRVKKKPQKTKKNYTKS
jgi:hypothetical protein